MRPADFLAQANNPKVSIVMFLKNGMPALEQSLESVANQTYQNIELVIQDAGSTDGSLEAIQRYSGRINIQLMSEPDKGVAEGYLRAMIRCTGDYIGYCLADEELLPNAVANAVQNFTNHPHAAAIFGDAYNTDLNGNVLCEIFGTKFDIVAYLFRTYTPHLSASFFRRSALNEIGLYQDRLRFEILEYDIWLRLALTHKIQYCPGFVCKYKLHPQQLSNNPKRCKVFLDHSLAHLENLFAVEGDLGALSRYGSYFCASHCIQLALHFTHFAGRDSNKFVQYLRKKARRYLAQPVLDQDTGRALVNINEHYVPSKLRRVYHRFVGLIPLHLKQNFNSRPFKLAAKTVIARVRRSLPTRTRKDLLSMAEAVRSLEDQAYSDFAHFFENRGQLDKAKFLFHKRDSNPILHGLACQASLKDPSASNQSLLEEQVAWAQKHAFNQPVTLQRTAKAKIRIGYMCAFWDASFMQYQVMPFIRRHDRTQFEIFGFYRNFDKAEFSQHFDQFIDTRNLKGAEFVNFMRSLELDVLVEFTGFSIGHRFVELSHRCAPVQISFVNHNGTSGTPNIDYVIGDEIASPCHLDPYFTESIYRLPRCFFCFNYEEADSPEITPPPILKNQFTTFGYMGSGGKISDPLLASWARILSKVPNSRFLIRNRELNAPGDRRYMTERFAKHGIGPERLLLLSGAAQRDICKSYSQIDISFDTWPYGGGNTTSEALWQGVPVISLTGSTFPSSYGSSLLASSGCSDLIAKNFAQYEDIAVQLAGDTEKLVWYRNNLRRLSFEHGFRDAEAYARSLEQAYKEMLNIKPLYNPKAEAYASAQVEGPQL